MGLNWKCPFSPFTYPITCKVEFWYSKSLCNRDTVSNRTYQNFRDQRLVRPGSKFPNWKRSQPISYKAKFSQRCNIYLVDLKCSITYQNTGGKLRSDQFLYHEIPKMAKSYLTTYMDELSTKLNWFIYDRDLCHERFKRLLAFRDHPVSTYLIILRKFNTYYPLIRTRRNVSFWRILRTY